MWYKKQGPAQENKLKHSCLSLVNKRNIPKVQIRVISNNRRPNDKSMIHYKQPIAIGSIKAKYK